MSRMHTAAVIALVTLGIYSGWNCISSLLSLLLTALSESYLPIVAYQLLQAGIFGGIAWVLIFRRNELASRIVPASEVTAPPLEAMWIPFGFRLAAVGAGLLMLPNAIFSLGQTLYAYISSKSEADAVMGQSMSQHATADRLLYSFFILAIAAYLICGAPHFVKWQVKKTLQQCGNAEHPPTSSPDISDA
jgi:hypothetical protein